MTVTVKSLEKEQLMRKLQLLLEAARVPELSEEKEMYLHIRKLPLRVLRSLIYRVEKSRNDSYTRGQLVTAWKNGLS